MRAFDERSIAVVPYFEAALYQPVGRGADARRGAGAGARDRECACWVSRARVRCWPSRTCSTRNRPRPTRAICWPTWRSIRRAPSSCAEHGYLTDNSAVGPALADALLGARQQRGPRRDAAQPDRRGLLGPLSGGRVQPVGGSGLGPGSGRHGGGGLTRGSLARIGPNWTRRFASCTAPTCWPTRATAQTRCARDSKSGCGSTIQRRRVRVDIQRRDRSETAL